MPLTTSFKNTLLNTICAKQNLTNSIYAGLAVSVNANGEVTGEPNRTAHPSYERAAVAVYGSNNVNNMGAATNGVIENNKTIYFPEARTSWGEGFEYVCLFNAATGGTLIGYAHIVDENDDEATIDINADTVPLIRAGSFKLAFVEPTTNE